MITPKPFPCPLPIGFLATPLLNTYHFLLLLQVGCDQIVKEEKCIGIDCYENVVLKLGDETAFDQRFLFYKKLNICKKLNFEQYIT